MKRRDDHDQEREPHFCECFGCGATLLYPGAKETPPNGNRIIGRSRGGGYLCGVCYEKGESFDYRDKAAADFWEAHRDDEWGMLLSAAHNLKGSPKEDYAYLMAMLKDVARRAISQSLPYDKTQRLAA